MAREDQIVNEPGILVVEDNGLIACTIEMLLAELGYGVVGPVPTIAAALDLLEQQTPRAALLDLHLGQSTSCDVAAALMERQIPFALLTGKIGPAPEQLRDVPLLGKPIDRRQLAETLASLCGRAGSHEAAEPRQA